MATPNKSESNEPVVRKPKRSFGNKRFYSYASAEGTKPYNELTEAERIAEGSRPYFAEPVSFRKTPSERARWKKFHTNAKGPVAPTYKPSYREIPHRLTVHLQNKKKDPKFITTHSFDVKRSEINGILRTFFNHKNDNIPEQKRPVITKVYFNGRIYTF